MIPLRPVVQLECKGKGHITFRRSTDGACLIQTFIYQGQTFNIDFDPQSVRILHDWLGQLLPEDGAPIISISGPATPSDLVDVGHGADWATLFGAVGALNAAVKDLRERAKGRVPRSYL